MSKTIWTSIVWHHDVLPEVKGVVPVQLILRDETSGPGAKRRVQ